MGWSRDSILAEAVDTVHFILWKMRGEGWQASPQGPSLLLAYYATLSKSLLAGPLFPHRQNGEDDGTVLPPAETFAALALPRSTGPSWPQKGLGNQGHSLTEGLQGLQAPPHLSFHTESNV